MEAPGLGLAICARLVELQGGSMSVMSAKGEGSTFSFKIRCGICSEPELAAQKRPGGKAGPARRIAASD